MTTNLARPLEFLIANIEQAVNVPLQTKTDRHLIVRASGLRGTRAELVLANVLSLHLTSKDRDMYIFQGRTVKTARMAVAVQEYLLQLLLLAAHNDDNNAARAISSSDAHYMLVGFKIAAQSQLEVDSRSLTSNEASGTSALAEAAAGTLEPAQGQTKTDLKGTVTSKSFVSSLSGGQRAFAGQYVKLRHARLVLQLSGAKIKIKRELSRTGSRTLELRRLHLPAPILAKRLLKMTLEMWSSRPACDAMSVHD